ncbi:hypothetical protein ILUMI_25884 [Ignelater luminosus]|uniref:AB hydrolase-1 domain-containing protein n=1 Tax=Ignelater luminosus TaxID=2038154 RepID=A0A8K0FZH3_IGNLU|nr:hypothetical protein ILUMI_25884 [Ignelater luminosus]
MSLLMRNRSYEEVRIPVPWGEYAGKWWGPRDKRPILALHGWQDNCGTFDRLIPYLPPDLGVLAIDLPGHGLSSHLPPGMGYYALEIVLLIQRIREYFKWPKVSILGHSIGAMYGYAYTLLYPKIVDFIICLDCLYPFQIKSYKTAETMAGAIKKFIKYDYYLTTKTNSEPPSYIIEKLEEQLHKASQGSIAKEMCKYILERNITKSKSNPNKFYIHRDPRVDERSLLYWSPKLTMEGPKRITCPIFLTLGNQSPFLKIKESALKIFETLRKDVGNNNTEYHVVEGTHHVHLNNPENVANLINAFIEKHDKEDRSIGGLIKNQAKLFKTAKDRNKTVYAVLPPPRDGPGLESTGRPVRTRTAKNDRRRTTQNAKNRAAPKVLLRSRPHSERRRRGARGRRFPNFETIRPRTTEREGVEPNGVPPSISASFLRFPKSAFGICRHPSGGSRGPQSCRHDRRDARLRTVSARCTFAPGKSKR